MSKYKLKFTLKQHTPIIHFQHNQHGATLRATEVKPKLDRFLIEKLGNGDYQAGIKEAKRKNWLVGKGDHPALDYKMRVKAETDKFVLMSAMPLNDTKKQSILNNGDAQELFGDFEVLDDSPYFADNEFIKFKHRSSDIDTEKTNWRALRVGVLYRNCSIEIEITVLISELKDKIDELFHNFISITNFGTRQSKGFGSFTTDRFTLSTQTCIFQKDCTGDYKAKLRTISKDWKLLKSGYNFGNTYYKSDLMKYFCMKNNIRWEKRKIKREIHNQFPALYNVLRKNGTVNRITGCQSDGDQPDRVPENNNYQYIRALLGLAEHNEYGKPGKPAKVKISNDTIKRYKSPVTFKVTEDKIYMICEPTPAFLSNNGSHQFSFDLSANHGGSSYSGNLATLPIPNVFNVCDFLNSPWLGNNFEHVDNWDKTNAVTVAEHHKYKKLS
jgi:hypothetical protein